MKRIFNILLLLLVSSVVIIGINKAVQAAEDEAYTPGTVHVTFIRTKKAPNETVIMHNWGATDENNMQAVSINDDKTVYNFEFKTKENEMSLGLIPVLGIDNGEGGLTQDWDNKLSFGGGDLAVDLTPVANGGDLYVVFTENCKSGEYVSAVATENERLAFVAYFAPAYEDTLGVHSWGFVDGQNASGWGTPLSVFKTIGHAGDGSDIKGTLFKAESTTAFAGAGFLIYAGTDDSKKHGEHGDIKVDNGDFEDYMDQVLNIEFVTGGNVYTSAAEFIDSAFVFKIIDMTKDSTTGQLDGTYAKNPTTVLVKVSAEILVPTVKVEAVEAKEADGDTPAVEAVEEVLYTTEERQEMLKEYFSIKDSDGNEMEIDHVDANLLSETGTKEFVVILKNALDNTKEYNLTVSASEEMTATKDINMDTEAPIITIISGKTTIELEYGKPITAAILPKYLSIDTRDGSITNLVYVKPGEGTVNSGKKGTYVVKLTVMDAWGNETQSEITFIVK